MKKTILVKLSLFVLLSLGTVANANQNSIEQNTNDIKIIKKALAKLIKEQNKLKKLSGNSRIKYTKDTKKTKSIIKSKKTMRFRLTMDRNVYKERKLSSKKITLLKKDTFFKSKDRVEDEWMFIKKEKGYIYLGKKNNRREKWFLQ